MLKSLMFFSCFAVTFDLWTLLTSLTEVISDGFPKIGHLNNLYTLPILFKPQNFPKPLRPIVGGLLGTKPGKRPIYSFLRISFLIQNVYLFQRLTYGSIQKKASGQEPLHYDYST